MENDFTERKDRINDTLSPGIIAEPLRSRLKAGDPSRYHVIIELNAQFPYGAGRARELVCNAITAATEGSGLDTLERDRESQSNAYIFAFLTADEIRTVIESDAGIARDIDAKDPRSTVERGVPRHEYRAIFRVWESMKVGPLTTVSIRTVKADAAQTAYAATGRGIVWAVLDSGVDASHSHFAKHANLDVDEPLEHRSFVSGADAKNDAFGHGTHVAGIIAGESSIDSPLAAVQSYDPSGGQQYHVVNVDGIRGMAPQCKILSLRVLDDNGIGDATSMLQALEYVQRLNDYGRNIMVHGLNISVGYPFDAQWYACGQTPVCSAVNRLVRSGVVVVVAAGNTGHVSTMVNVSGAVTGASESGQPMTINDPGNADLAITVGSTDREKPHLFGVSYFSSKGPTGDGRCKPDLVAPGEHIISAATGANCTKVPAPTIPFQYIEDSGTSMAAPHVSGAIAGFLSVRREFIEQAQKVREMAVAAAMDLQRDRNLQGAGLIDLMRLIQSV